MALSQSLQLKQLQRLSPQQIQLMKLLQVPSAQIEQRIKEELEENPALEMNAELMDLDTDKSDELTDDIKKSVSPRRLQYALDMFVNKGDIRDVLPANSNVTKLLTSLKTGPITEKIDELMANRDEDKARTFLENENNFAAAIKFIGKSDTLLEYFAPLMPHEKLASLMSTDDKLCGFIIKIGRAHV